MAEQMWQKARIIKVHFIDATSGKGSHLPDECLNSTLWVHPAEEGPRSQIEISHIEDNGSVSKVKAQALVCNLLLSERVRSKGAKEIVLPIEILELENDFCTNPPMVDQQAWLNSCKETRNANPTRH